jgi:hypothetical protein
MKKKIGIIGDGNVGAALQRSLSKAARKRIFAKDSGQWLVWVFGLGFLFSSHTCDAAGRESPAQMRRIVAQSLCLAAAYPGTELARDSEIVFAAYAPALRLEEVPSLREKMDALIQAEDPTKPTPVNDHHLALAKCALFAERQDVMTLLTRKK